MSPTRQPVLPRKLGKLVLGVLLLSGPSCLRSGAGDQDGNEASLVASVDGIDPADRARDNITYELVCKGAGRLVGQPRADGAAVRFDGTKVKDGDLCALEVKIPEGDAAKLDWSWFGVFQGKPVVGLLYGSDEKKVENRALHLTIYRLYAPKDADTFAAEVAVTLELGGLVMPDESKMAAALDCDGARYAGAFKKTADRDGVLHFPGLKVSALKGKQCPKVVVMVDNVASYEGASTEIAFPDPKLGELYKFPKDASQRVLMTSKVPGTDGVSVDTANGGPCLRFEEHVCKDRRTIALPLARNVIRARVTGKRDDGRGETISLYVGAGPAGFGVLNARELTTADLNAGIANLGVAGATSKFSFYDVAMDRQAIAPDFNADFVAGVGIEQYLMKPEDLAHILLLDLTEVEVHGFHEVRLETLDLLYEARWLAVVTASKPAAADVQFIVTGSDRYFRSLDRPGYVNSRPTFFDFSGLVSDMASASSHDRWRAYALKGGAMVPSGCQADLAYYLTEMSTRNEDTLRFASNADSTLEGCEIGNAGFDASLGSGWEITPKIYEWGWWELGT